MLKIELSGSKVTHLSKTFRLRITVVLTCDLNLFVHILRRFYGTKGIFWFGNKTDKKGHLWKFSMRGMLIFCGFWKKNILKRNRTRLYFNFIIFMYKVLFLRQLIRFKQILCCLCSSLFFGPRSTAVKKEF